MAKSSKSKRYNVFAVVLQQIVRLGARWPRKISDAINIAEMSICVSKNIAYVDCFHD
jgi:hypothetical protein